MRFKECHIPVCDIKSKSLTDLSPINTKPLMSKISSEKDIQKMMSEPKHPPSALMFFMEDFRKEMVGKEPQGGVPAMAKLGSQRWRSMTDTEKQPYMEKQSEARLHYDNSMEEYLKRVEEIEKNHKTKIVKVVYKVSEKKTSTKKRYPKPSDNSDNEEDSDYRVDDDQENGDFNNKKEFKRAKENSDNEKDSDYQVDDDQEDSDQEDSDYGNKKKFKNVKKKTSTKKRYSKSSENSDNEEDSDYQIDDDKKNSDFNNKKEFKRAKMDESLNEDSENCTKIGGEISEYEKMIEKNRAESLAFLQSLKIDEAKSSLAEAVQKKKPQVVKRCFQKRAAPEPQVRRKSNRLANVNMDLSEEGIFNRAVKEAKEAKVAEMKRLKEMRMRQIVSEIEENWKPNQRKKKKRIINRRYHWRAGTGVYLGENIPKNLAFKQAMQYEELYDRYIKDINIQESKPELKFVSYDKPIITKLTLDENNIAKVTPSRITALAWYPSPEYLVVAAGSKYGKLGIWNVDSESNPYIFKPHAEGITNLKFNPLNSVQLFTSSYDGALRYCDMIKHVFNEIYNVNETSCTYFDFLSETTCLVAQQNGQVALVDNRAERKCSQKMHKCHENSIKTVDVHPVNRNFFITAENKGTVRLWDLRKLQNEPVADIMHHKRCVQSAFFSPVTGNSILTTSADDTVALFDSTQLTKDIKLKQTMKHNNYTGRWLSVFRATWLPNSDEAFFIGSMQFPRRIQVYDKNMDVYHIFMHDNLRCITSTNAFHPFRPAVAGANSSGKVYIFK